MKRKPTVLPFSFAVLAATAAAAGALYFQHRHAAGEPAVHNPATFTSPTPEGAILPEAVPTPPAVGAKAAGIVMYRVITDENGSHLKKVDAPPGEGGKPATAESALNAMADEQDSPLPPGTHVLSYAENNAVATVDFNGAFVKNFPGGDTAEALALESILSTVGQFGPRSVQITVEGKKIDSLGGTQSLTAPVPVPQTASAATAPAAPTATPEQTAQGITKP